MPDFTQSDLADAMLLWGGNAGRAVADNPKLLKSTFDMVAAVKKKDLAAGLSAGAGLASAGTRAAGAGKGTQTATKATAFVFGEMKATLGMSKALTLSSPGRLYVFVGATVVQKTGLAMALAGSSNERAQCIAALMEVSANAAITAVTAPTGVLAALSAMSLAASTVHAWQACSVPGAL